MKKIKLLITKILSAFFPILFLYSRNKVCVLLHDKGVMDVSKKRNKWNTAWKLCLQINQQIQTVVTKGTSKLICSYTDIY